MVRERTHGKCIICNRGIRLLAFADVVLRVVSLGTQSILGYGPGGVVAHKGCLKKVDNRQTLEMRE